MASGFADGNNLKDFIAGCAFVVAYIAMLIYLLKKKNWFMAAGAFFITPFIFLGWKEAFVRADGHTTYFEHAIYLSLLYVINLKNSMLRMQSTTTSEHPLHNMRYILVVVIVIIIGPSLKQSLLPNNELLSYFNISKNAEQYYGEIERNKENVRNQYAGFAAAAEYIAGETVDIFPWDISALYAYGLNWVPRPVPQSYSDYTDILDNLTAGHFTSDNAPQKILYGLTAIDGRYPAFDEPATFRTVLERYNLVTNINDYLLLDRSKTAKEPQRREIGTYRAKIGEAIDVPIVNNAYVYMNIDWKPTLLGKLANFVLKAPLNHILFTLDYGSKPQYRFIRSPAKNGLFVSTFVGDISDLANVFKGDFIPNITSVTIAGNPWFYKKQFDVSFFAVPLEQFDRTVDVDVKTTTIAVEFHDELQTGLYQMFYAVDQVFSEWQSKRINLNAPAKRLEFTLPKRNDINSWRLDFPEDTLSEYRILSIENLDAGYKSYTVDGTNGIDHNNGNVKVTGADPFFVFHFISH
ncbi:hypothetical protein FACS189462_3800 [Spirochaetia bacterium]|nr:hypothetical protein FACS189462_3800 [Spirochaetia bacterium]